jgi:hypothetical protein
LFLDFVAGGGIPRYGVATSDPAVLAAVAALLAAVSISAVYVPALAVTRVDPKRTLRR